MSPEVCRSEPYNWKSDIWVLRSVDVLSCHASVPTFAEALGCVLYEWLPELKSGFQLVLYQQCSQLSEVLHAEARLRVLIIALLLAVRAQKKGRRAC